MPRLTIRSRPGSSCWQYDLTSPGFRSRGSTFLPIADFTREQAYDIMAGHLLAEERPDGEETLDRMKDNIARRLDREGVAEGTVALYDRAMRELIDTLGPEHPVAKVSKADVGRIQDRMLDRGCSPAYTNLICRHLRAAFQRLVDDELLERNPFRRFKPIRETSKPQHLTEAEIARFLKSVAIEKNEGIRRLIYLLLFTGRRRTEILELRREDVDLSAMTMRVMNVKDREHRMQTIDIPPGIQDDVRWFMKQSPRSQPFAVVKPDSLTQAVKRHMTAAGLPYHLHSLRHTFITHALRQGVDIHTLKEHVGHSTVLVTERYAHDRKRGAIEIGIKRPTDV